jgi:hypothetical protein
MIRNVVLELGQNRLRAVLLSDGSHIEIAYKWWQSDKRPRDIPPVKWHEAVYGELEYHKGEKQKAATGRPTLPW